MKRIFRAAGFAAAAVAFFAAASSPSLAVDLDQAPAAGFTAHEGAQVDDSDLGLNDAAPPVAQANPLASLFLQAASLVTGHDEQAGEGSGPRTLDELVDALAEVAVSDAEQDCLAKAVYFEARSEPIQGQLAVAQVVLNRAASGRYPSTLCAVVLQPAQFSFIRSGRFPKADRSSAAWRKAVAIAHIARERLAKELAPNVLWYHADYVSPSWGRRLTRQTQIGLHIFYS